MAFDPFAFFIFYYNVITKNPKKYDNATEPTSAFSIMVTPFLMFLLFCFSLVIFAPEAVLSMMIWIPIVIGNILYFERVRSEGFRIKREERQREHDRQWQEWERERKRRQAEYEAEWRKRMEQAYEHRRRYQGQQRHQRRRAFNFDGNRYYYNESTRQYEYIQPKSRDKNRENAMSLLGLSEGFTQDDVKKAYRRLSKKHHPDMGGTEENFIRLNKAYKYLMK